MQIGRVARTTGLTVETIRYYERMGLIPLPVRRETLNGPAYRLFSEEHVRRLNFIKRARAIDLSLDQIKQLLEAVGDGCCGSARPSLAAIVTEKLHEVDERIGMLETLRSDLVGIQGRLTKGAIGTQQQCDCPSSADVAICAFGEESLEVGKGGEK